MTHSLRQNGRRLLSIFRFYSCEHFKFHSHPIFLDGCIEPDKLIYAGYNATSVSAAITRARGPQYILRYLSARSPTDRAGWQASLAYESHSRTDKDSRNSTTTSL